MGFKPFNPAVQGSDCGLVDGMRWCRCSDRCCRPNRDGLGDLGSGLTFGVFLFTFNFYVLSLGPGYDEAFLGTLQSAASFATIAMAIPAAWIAQRSPTQWGTE